MAEHWKDLVGKANALMDQVEDILVKGSPEDKLKVKDMMVDIDRFKGEAIQLKQIEALRGELKAYEQPGAQGGTSVATPQGGSQFKDFGEFITSVSRWAQGIDPRLKRFKDNDEKAAEAKDMTGATGAGGGFLIPTEFQATLLSVAQERSIVRGRATRIPMARRQINIPILDQTGTTAGQPHWFGGLRAYWTEEASQKNTSDATFRQLALTAYKLVMFTRASDELLDDSAISLAAFLGGDMGFAGAISWMEDFAFLQGSGVGQPLGVINSPALLSFNRAGAGAIAYADLTGMMRRFLPTGRGVWIVNQSAMAQLLELNGPAGNPSYIWGSAVSGAPNTLLGLPVIWTEKTPALGTKGDIILADWSFYLIGDRQSTTIESTKFEKWEFDETSWRAVHRVDGRPWLSAPLTYQDGATQVSPFVCLNT